MSIRPLRSYVSVLALAVLLGLANTASAAPPAPYPLEATPGTPAEEALVLKNAGSIVADGSRHVDPGGFWVYSLPGSAGARCTLTLGLLDEKNGPPHVEPLGQDAKPLPVSIKGSDTSVTATWTLPASWAAGARVSVLISGKPAAATILKIHYETALQDSLVSGIPDSVTAWMVDGLAPGVRPSAAPKPVIPFTITQTGRPNTPAIDLQTDAVFAYTTDLAAINSWKTRGYTTWTMGGARDNKAYADAHPGDVQTRRAGDRIHIDDSYYLTPTQDRIAAERSYFLTALANGSDGVCPEEPEYFAAAGYEDAFRAAWKRIIGTPWQDPAGSVSARWSASRVMAALETDHVAGVLQGVSAARPEARRLVALHSPINYALWGVVAPQFGITSLPAVQEVIGQTWTGTARTPVRYAGVTTDRTFDLAYLEYSSLYQLLRGTGKRLWFLVDPVEDDPSRSMDDYRTHYELTVAAALQFPGVDAYEVLPWPDRVYGRVPADFATTIGSVNAAMQEMHNTEHDAAPDPGIGVFVSDEMQWQRAQPDVSNLDGLFGLSLPLLQHGVPVQALSLDRAAEPGYLTPFHTLLLSYDFQKPADSRADAALADWVRRGGSLVVVGGSDAFNGVPGAWWRTAGYPAPQIDLLSRLGVAAGTKIETMSSPPPAERLYTVLLKGDGAEHNTRNRGMYTIDLTRFVSAQGSVAVRFTDVTPQDGWGPLLYSAVLKVGGNIAASFLPGADLENRFIEVDDRSQVSGLGRFADGTASWIYRFDNLPHGTPVQLTLELANGFQVSAAPAIPDTGHTLLAVGDDNPLAKALPRMRIGPEFVATLYPGVAIAGADAPPAAAATLTAGARRRSGPIVSPGRQNGQESGPLALYRLRSGGAAIWTEAVGKGALINVGVDPAFFAASERSAGLLRGIAQYAQQRAGALYHEPGRLVTRRGRFTIVRTFDRSETIDEPTMDLFSPTLALTAHRVIPSRSVALLCDAPQATAVPQIGFVSGRLAASLLTPARTGFYARGPAGTNGAARLFPGSRHFTGARAVDIYGRPVAVEATSDGDSLLLTYPNDPDGVAIRVSWD